MDLVRHGLAAFALAWLVAGCSAGDGGPIGPGDPGGGDASAEEAAPDLPGAEADVPVDTLPPDAGPAPRVRFLEPGRGTFASKCDAGVEARILVESGRTLDAVSVQGKGVTLADGEATATVPVAAGLNLLAALATDDLGRTGSGHRAMLCGEYVPPSSLVAHGADLYLGRQAIAATGRLAARLFDDTDLTAVMTARNPLYASSLLTAEAVSTTHAQGTVVSLVPAWDQLQLHLEVTDLTATIRVVLLGPPPKSWDVVVSSDLVMADAIARLALEDGQVETSVEDLVFDLHDPTVEIPGVTSDLLAVFPDVKDKLVAVIQEQLAAMLTSYVTEAVDGAVGRLGEPVGMSVLGREFEVRFRPSELKSTPYGLHLALDLSVEGLAPDPAYASPGALATPGQEEWPDVEGFRLSVKDDLVNGVFHEAWRSGLLAFLVDQAFLDSRKAEVDLVAGFLGGVLDLLPGGPIDPETPIAIGIAPTFPPVADMDLPLAGGVRVAIGDLLLDVTTAASPPAPLMSLAVTVRLEGAVSPAPGGVEVAFGHVDVALDVKDDDGNLSDASAYLQETTAGLLDSLGPTVAGLLGTVPIPVLHGFTVANLTAGTDRADGGVIVIAGDLVEASAGGGK
jgi:hypothetical protein